VSKITVSLGVTLCTDPETRNFLRVGIEANDIDTDGDVEAQAQASLVASLKVIKVLDDGLKEAITDIIMDSDKPGLMKDTLAAHEDKLTRVARVLHSVSARIAELETKLVPHDA
jgi:hypothetical protein